MLKKLLSPYNFNENDTYFKHNFVHISQETQTLVRSMKLTQQHGEQQHQKRTKQNFI